MRLQLAWSRHGAPACGKLVTCGACTGGHPCVLTRNHPGGCIPRHRAEG